MSRRIVTTELQAVTGSVPVDTYFDRVVKYIPADIVSAWVFVSSVINSSSDDLPKAVVLWIAFGCGVVLTALWTLKQTAQPKKPPAVKQTLISTGAFAVWVFALGGPFVNLAVYRPLYGSLVLVLYTLLVALVVPKERKHASKPAEKKPTD